MSVLKKYLLPEQYKLVITWQRQDIGRWYLLIVKLNILFGGILAL